MSGFDHTAIEWSMPDRLRAIGADLNASATATHFSAVRLWTTMLSVVVLRGLSESFLMRTPEADGFEETIVDRTMDWVRGQREEHEAVAAAWAELWRAAEETVAAWDTRHVRFFHTSSVKAPQFRCCCYRLALRSLRAPSLTEMEPEAASLLRTSHHLLCTRHPCVRLLLSMPLPHAVHSFFLRRRASERRALRSAPRALRTASSSGIA